MRGTVWIVKGWTWQLLNAFTTKITVRYDHLLLCPLQTQIYVRLFGLLLQVLSLEALAVLSYKHALFHDHTPRICERLHLDCRLK